MEAENINIIKMVKGVPLLSERFDAQVLVNLVAHYRHVKFCHYDNISHYLYPEKIEQLYRHKNQSLGIEYPEEAQLEDDKHQSVKNAIGRIQNIMPEWQVYFALPVLFKKINKNKNMVSLTNHHIPQTIFLGAKAFKSEAWLEEVIIHEMAHVWLGLLCEIDSFHDCSSNNKYTLPSGTKDKDARGVIFASHFSACVIKVLNRKRLREDFLPEDEERLKFLQRYFSGCMAQLSTMNELKKIGHDIANIMEETHYG